MAANMPIERVDEYKIKLHLDRWEVSGSDSSDEEDVVEQYDVINALSLFTMEQSNNKAHEMDYLSGHNHLSFIAHAVGIQLLYSKPVQQRYYELKREKLKDSFTLPTHEQIRDAVRSTLDSISFRIPKTYQSRDRKQLDVFELEQETIELISSNLIEFCTSTSEIDLIVFFCKIASKYKLNHRYLLGESEGRTALWNLCMVPQMRSIDTSEYSYDLSRSDSFALDFFANLRLHNTQDKRKLKYQERQIFPSNQNEKREWAYKSNWKYSDNAEITINHPIEKGTSIKGTAKTNIYRNESVTFRDSAESYRTIVELWIVSSAVEAKLLQQIFHGEASNVSTDIAKLHYLLFGTEAVRNPSALIHNSMMLDLISNGELTWEGAFKGNMWEEEFGGIMPMSMKGAMEASRIISRFYTEHMPSNYSYDYKPEYTGELRQKACTNAENLLRKEQKITKSWLSMKMGSDLDDYFDDNELKIGKVQEIFQLIQAACGQWFSIDL